MTNVKYHSGSLNVSFFDAFFKTCKCMILLKCFNCLIPKCPNSKFCWSHCTNKSTFSQLLSCITSTPISIYLQKISSSHCDCPQVWHSLSCQEDLNRSYSLFCIFWNLQGLVIYLYIICTLWPLTAISDGSQGGTPLSCLLLKAIVYIIEEWVMDLMCWNYSIKEASDVCLDTSMVLIYMHSITLDFSLPHQSTKHKTALFLITVGSNHCRP